MPVIADQVAVLAGGQCALFSAALCLLEHGDEVIVMDPTYATWLDIAKLCCQHDLWLISDEVYAELVFEEAHISPAPQGWTRSNLLTCCWTVTK